MERLEQSDLRNVLDFLRDCYAIREFTSFEDFVRELVIKLPRLIPAAHVTYNEMYPHQAESHNCVNTDELASAEAAYLWQEHMNEHPVVGHILKTGDRRAVRISDFWSERRLHDTGLHNDFYRHYDIEDALCVSVPAPAPLLIGVGWHDDRTFTDAERLIAELVRPHITQAWLNAKLLTAVNCQLQLLKQGLESEGRGTIACDSDCHVQFMTSSARRYLIEYFDQPLDQLPDDLFRWVKHENTQLASDDVPSPRVPLVKEKGNKRLTVRLLSNAEANLLFLEEENSAAFDPAALKKFGLSLRESEVLAWVAQGKTNSEVATILGISLGTAKKHLEHILQKLGVETRTAAAALALQWLSRNDEVR